LIPTKRSREQLIIILSIILSMKQQSIRLTTLLISLALLPLGRSDYCLCEDIISEDVCSNQATYDGIHIHSKVKGCVSGEMDNATS
jgi:hypothetical protein